MRTATAVFYLSVFALAIALSGETNAGGLGISTPIGSDPDSIQSPQIGDLIEKTFYAYRPKSSFTTRAGRDFEFLWSDSFNVVRGWAPNGGMILTDQKTLDTLGVNIAEKPSNPFRAELSDVRLVHDYFQFYPGRQSYDPNPQALNGFILGNDPSYDRYNDRDRNHVDYYLYYPGERNQRGGRHVSSFISGTEDTSSAGPPVAVRDSLHFNSIMVEGPRASIIADTTGQGWAGPDRAATFGFAHEFQHAMNLGGVYGEIMSEAAEALAGSSVAAEPPVFDVPYTWPLLAFDATSPSGPLDLFRMQQNYQGWLLFSSYLLYNFRGADTLATLSGFTDDLVYRWRRAGASVTLRDLANVLTDGLCGTCVGKQYFLTASGDTLPRHDRLQLLLHNWRVANFVNNSLLGEGQYGYPTVRGFIPWRDVGAWRSLDGERHNDIVAIPPEVTLSYAGPASEIRRTTNRYYVVSAGDTVSHPMRVMMFGSEYWIARSDVSIGSGNDLVVTVEAESLVRRKIHGSPCALVPASTAHRVGRLMASVVGYTQATDSLWRHPEWAAVDTLMKPQWVDLDSVSGPLQFTVRNFGSSYKAAVVVISLADASGYTSGLGSGLTSGDLLNNQVPYRIALAVRRAPYQTVNPMLAAGASGTSEDSPTWAPSGAELAYQVDSAGASTIRRKGLSGGAAQTLTTGRFPDWSPRGNLIAFVRDSVSGGSRVWLYDTLTAQASQLTFKAGSAVSPVLSPNGQHIAYAHSVYDFPLGQSIQEANCVPCGWELHRVDVTGVNDTLLLRLYGEFDMRSVRWAPDGRWIYLKKRPTLLSGLPGPDQLWIVARDGTQAFTRVGLADDASTFDLHRGMGGLVLEQAGNYLWMCGSSTEFLPFERVAIRDTLRGDTQPCFYVTGAEYHNPRLSPEGTRVAYSSNLNSANSNDRDVFVGQVSFNHAPQLAGLGDVVAHIGKPFGMVITATDSDGEALSYASPAAFWPSGASFTPATRYFSWPSPGPVCSENFVVFRALDGSGGVASRVVKITTVIDSIDDLNAEIVGDDEVWLTWTAPGDNGSLGRGVEYELRYAQIPLTEWTFPLGTRVTGMAAPAVPGMNETQAVYSLSSGTNYYFAIRTKDAKGNWSILSNVVQVTTTSGGGGSEYGAQQVQAPLTGLRTAQTAISRPGLGGSVAALAVEMGFGGGAPVWSIRQLNADEVIALGAGDSTSVLLQARDGEGAWYNRARVLSKDATWRFGVRALRRPGRIVFIGSYGMRQAWNSVELDGRSGAARLVTAQHTRLGDVKSGFDSSGTARLEVGTADTLTLSYELVTQDSETAQDWFVLVGPPGSEVSTPVKARRGVSEGKPLPTAFALGQNRPNPFSGKTAIHFELPVETQVRLEIFDAQGRLARTLADGGYPAGFHVVEWDHRTDGELALGAGVYLYRIQAGKFRAQKKMVLLAR